VIGGEIVGKRKALESELILGLASGMAVISGIASCLGAA